MRATGSNYQKNEPMLIPTIWRIDVEPDEHQPSVGQEPWKGFVGMAELVDRVRNRLGDRSGRAPCPTWMLRMDPDIERCFGHLDFVVRRHADVFDQLTARNDRLGIHVHAYRWNSERAVPYSDYADATWPSHCLRVAAEAFAGAFGEQARVSSQGGYLLTEPLLNVCAELGITVDLTAEPGQAALLHDPAFGEYATAPSTSFVDFPRRPYYPSRGDVSVPAPSPADAQPVLIVPLTAYDYRSVLRPWHRQIAHTLLRRPRLHSPLSPWKPWPSPKVFWDLVSRAIDEQPACYLALATRTDDPASEWHRRAWELFEYLPNHPLAERLQFVDSAGAEIRALA